MRGGVHDRGSGWGGRLGDGGGQECALLPRSPVSALWGSEPRLLVILV